MQIMSPNNTPTYFKYWQNKFCKIFSKIEMTLDGKNQHSFKYLKHLARQNYQKNRGGGEGEI